MRVALAQIDCTVGDIGGNRARIADVIRHSAREGAQIVVLPELAIPGYPPEDLLLNRSFIAANRRALDELALVEPDVAVLVGFAERAGERLYNSAAISHGGRVLSVYRKHHLPNYGVFDEHRYFEPGRGHTLVETSEGTFGVSVCEDLWSDRGPVIRQGRAGAQIVFNINASPYHKGKLAERAELLARRGQESGATIVYVNMVGGQDELIFDGGSLVIAPDGELVARLPQFEHAVAVLDVPWGEAKSDRLGDREQKMSDHPSIKRVSIDLRTAAGPSPARRLAPSRSADEELYEALKLALRDYVSKNGFEKVVVGLSGGIDSSLTATIAVDALGADSVLAVAMPSEFSSAHSLTDAKELCSNLGIEMLEIGITPAFHAYLRSLEEAFGETEHGLAEENLQARVRGNILMAVSNRYGHLVLTTGNKSETAVGYSTLYGDTAGGFAILKDVLKTEVYALARYRNSLGEAIPENVLSKPPSAELRPDQTDEESLMPYEDLDPILEAYIEHNRDVSEIVSEGHAEEAVRRIVTLVDRAEYKRRQAPPGPKVTVKAFGKDRRLPITNQWRHDPSVAHDGEAR